MTKPEMYRRMLTCTLRDFQEGVQMVRDGYGARGIEQNSPLTLKQANACFEWVEHYGMINPTDVELFMAEPKLATVSEWLVRNTDSHGIQDSDALKAAYVDNFGKDAATLAPPDWPSHTEAETAMHIMARGKGGELKQGTGKRLCYGYQVAEYFARELAGWKPWQIGLGFRWQSAVEALQAKGL